MRWIIIGIFQEGLLEVIFKRIVNGNGILISLIGLLVVFSGLVMIWLITAFIPKLVYLLENRGRSQNADAARLSSGASQESDSLSEMAAAIGLALCYELEDEEMTVLTLRHIEQDVSPWVVASRQSTMRH